MMNHLVIQILVANQMVKHKKYNSENSIKKQEFPSKNGNFRKLLFAKGPQLNGDVQRNGRSIHKRGVVDHKNVRLASVYQLAVVRSEKDE